MVISTMAAENRCHVVCLAGADFDSAVAANLDISRAVCGDAAIEVQAVVTAVQGQRRVVAYFRLELFHIALRQVRRIGYQPITGARRNLGE